MQKDQDFLKGRLFRILEEDIKKVSEVIKENYSEIYNDFKDNKDSKFVPSINFDIFKSLMNETCFNSIFHTKTMPFSQMSDDKTVFFDLKVYDIPEYKLNAFNELFRVPNCNVIIPYDFNSNTAIPMDAKKLYYLFFHNLFHRVLRSKKNTEQIFNILLTEWRIGLKTKKVPIKFNIHLDKILIEKDYKNQPFQLKNVFLKEITRLAPYKAKIFIPRFLVFETEIPIFIYETNKENDTQHIQDDYVIITHMRKKFEEFKNFMCSLYFHNYYLPNPNPILKFPWWIEPECQYLNKFSKKEDDKYIFKNVIRLTENNFKTVLETYTLLEEKGFYSNSCFPLLFSVKNLAFSRPFKLERVFYSHILLEFLFSPRVPMDLSFKIPLNASLLISDNYDEFYKQYIFFREMYNFRSKAIHGKNWIDLMVKMRNRLNRNGFNVKSETDLLKKIDKIILKILNSLINFPSINSSIIESFEENNLVSFRIKKYEYLIQLGDYYKEMKKYIPSLKVFSEAYRISQLLADSKKTMDSGDKLKQIYNININLLVYNNELNLVLQELLLISKYNSNKQTIATEIQGKITELKEKMRTHPNTANIKLKINGNTIMKVLNLEPGPIVGKILSLIKTRIKLGELENEENILRSYLKTIDLSKISTTQ